MPWWVIVLLSIGAVALSVVFVLCYWIARMIWIESLPIRGWNDEE